MRRSAGKRPFEVAHPEVWPALEKLVDPVTRGDPESPLRWTCKSTHVLAAELFAQHGIRISDRTVAKLLREHGYSLQAPNKSVEGAQHPDRNAQFEHINAKAEDCIERGVPVISVDTKKKELVGNFKNGGREWQPQGEPELVDVHDFPSDAVGKAIPYGVYDVARERRVRQRRHRPRHARVRGHIDRGVVEAGGLEALPRCARDLHHRRCGRQQQLPIARLEARAAAPRRQASACRSTSATSRRARASGTRSSTASSRSSRSTGVVDRCGPTRRSSTSSATRRTVAGSSCARDSTSATTRSARRSLQKSFAQLNIERDDFHGDWNYVIRPRAGRNERLTCTFAGSYLETPPAIGSPQVEIERHARAQRQQARRGHAVRARASRLAPPSRRLFRGVPGDGLSQAL